jgi:hypothetical protein
MTTPSLKAILQRLLDDDPELYSQLCEMGLVPRDDGALAPEHLETARVVRTLVRELDVNWPGVEIVLRMRTELMATRRQLHELAAVVRRQRVEDPPR